MAGGDVGVVDKHDPWGSLKAINYVSSRIPLHLYPQILTG